MSEAETRELVTRAFATFNAGDHDALLALLSEDVIHEAPGATREIGKDKLRWRLAEAARHIRVQAADIAVMTAPGGLRAAAEFTLSGTYLATAPDMPEAKGQNFRLAAGIFLEIDDDGLISRLTLCCDPAALRAELEDA